MKWVDLSPYKPVSGAAVASTPIANGLQKVQDSLNSVGVAGAAIASAGTINITNPVHQITGGTAIATISDANVPTVGETVTLWIQTGLTIQNNGGGVGNIRTLSGADRVCKANEIVVLLYDGAVWRETNPQAAGAPYRKTTPKTVNTTVAATDLLNGEITVAGGVMGTSGLLRLTAWGDWLQNTGAVTASPRLQLLLGGTTLLDTGVGQANSVLNNATRLGWRVSVEIMNLGAANSQSCFINFELDAITNTTSTGPQGLFTTGEGTYGVISGPAGTGPPGMMKANGWNSAAKDTTGALALVLNVINPSALVTCEMKLYGALVEIV